MTRVGMTCVGAAVAAVLGFASVATSAHAGTINVTGSAINNDSGFGTSIEYLGLSIKVGNTTYNETGGIGAGEIVLTTASGVTPAWCVDFTHTIQLGGALTLTTAPVISGTSNLPTLSITQINQIEWLAYLGQTALGTTYPQVLSAEYQMAIWTVEYGSGLFSISNGIATSGNVTLSSVGNFNGADPSTNVSAFATATNGLITTARNDAASAPPGFAMALISNGSQTLLEVVPEPASLALLGAGLFGLGMIRRRNRPT